jgi:hypothetical protein
MLLTDQILCLSQGTIGISPIEQGTNSTMGKVELGFRIS